VGKHYEAVYGFCVRALRNYGSKRLGCTKEMGGATVTQDKVASPWYENMVVGSVELVDHGVVYEFLDVWK